MAPVHPGEGVSVLLLTANAFCLLTAYYIIKPVREELILATSDGAEFKAYASGATALVLLGAVPLYSALASRWPRERLVVGVTLFFAACMALFYALGQSPALRPQLGVPFYLWVGTFSMMVVAQFWAFANDLYAQEQGERLFAILGLGAAGGAVFGSKATSWLLAPPPGSPLPQLDVFELLWVSAGLLVVTVILTVAASRGATTPRSTSAPSSRKGGFTLVLGDRYLRYLAAFSLLFTLANANGEYMLSRAVSDAFEQVAQDQRDGWIGRFYGDFYFWVNLLGFLIQTFVVSRVVRVGGLRLGFLILPVLVLLGGAVVAVVPVLAVLRVAKTVENATDYSLNNTVRNMLWLPTTVEMKYKAKQAVDTFMVRMGDVLAGVAVYVGNDVWRGWTGAAVSLRGFALLNVVVACGWLWLALRILRLHRERSGPGESGAARDGDGGANSP